MTSAAEEPGYGPDDALVSAYAKGAAAAIARFGEEQRLPLPPPDGEGFGKPGRESQAHLVHLGAVLTIARYQLRLVEDGSTVVRTGQLELWNLRTPGYLRAIVRVGRSGFLGWRRPGLARLGAAAQRLEAELHVPLTRLREALVLPPSAEFAVRAWETQREVAERLGRAAEGLVAAGPSVERLGEVVARLEDGLPDLERQAVTVGGLDDRLRRSAADMVERTRPLVDFALNAEQVVARILAATEQSREALDLARARFAEAAELARLAEERRLAVTATAQPLVDAAADLARAATVLDATSGRLWGSIEKANWLALVADGLRHPDPHLTGPGTGSDDR